MNLRYFVGEQSEPCVIQSVSADKLNNRKILKPLEIYLISYSKALLKFRDQPMAEIYPVCQNSCQFF